ncbi:hypothetical protein HK102_001407 [Quaeritorhiza haematococci]|nr:hypothetical protein HK102_001407 [Quaeritorhiza haematococci]
MSDSDFLIVAGTYERLLYGIEAKWSAKAEPEGDDDAAQQHSPALEPIFIYPAHITCIKALTTGGRFLATGSTDEHVKIYDLRLRKEVGTLLHHAGSITCLKFFGPRTHLISASEDGSIAIFRTRDWELLKVLSGHKSAVMWVDVHSSGKVLLSCGKDGTLKCWDLVRGLCARSIKLTRNFKLGYAERVVWSPSGDRYALMSDGEVEVQDIETGKVIGKWRMPRRNNTLCYTTLAGRDGEDAKEVIVLGGEDKTLSVWTSEGTCLMRWKTGHQSRVKDVAAIYFNKTATPKTIVSSCSSDGSIRIWDLEAVRKDLEKDSTSTADSQQTSSATSGSISRPEVLELTPMAEYDAKCRLTCLTIVPASVIKAHPRSGDKTAANQENEMEAVSEAGSSDDEGTSASQQKAGPVATVTVSYESETATSNANGSAASKKRPARDQQSDDRRAPKKKQKTNNNNQNQKSKAEGPNRGGGKQNKMGGMGGKKPGPKKGQRGGRK